MAYENPTRTPSGILTFLTGLIVLVIFAGLVAWWIGSQRTGENVQAKRAEARIATRDRLAKEHADRLATSGWVDKAAGVAHIPLEQAMKLTVSELQQKKPVASTVKVEAPLPVSVPDPNATEPPPPALPAAPQGADMIQFNQEAPKAPAGASAPSAALHLDLDLLQSEIEKGYLFAAPKPPRPKPPGPKQPGPKPPRPKPPEPKKPGPKPPQPKGPKKPNPKTNNQPKPPRQKWPKFPTPPRPPAIEPGSPYDNPGSEPVFAEDFDVAFHRVDWNSRQISSPAVS